MLDTANLFHGFKLCSRDLIFPREQLGWQLDFSFMEKMNISEFDFNVIFILLNLIWF